MTTSGTYSVQADVSGCTASDAIDVVVLPVPTADLGNDTTICAGTTLMLDASYPGASYEWSTGSTASSITVSTAGTYSVDVGLGICMASDDIVVNVLAPGAIALGADTSFCQGGTLVLDATLPGATYLWSTGATTPTISVTTSGTFSVQADVSGCAASDAIDVTVLPMPVVDLGNDTTLCSGASHTLDASYPGATYLWSTGSTSSSIVVSSADSYSVDVDLNGCVATDGIVVDVLSAVAIDLGNDTSLCPGATLTLDATLPGASYLWQDGSTNSSFTATGPGSYSVEVTVSGCSATDAITIGALSAPAVELGNDTTLCVGAILMLDASEPGATYSWQDGSGELPAIW